MIETFFKPWVGSNYSKETTKLLVFGDSHYCGCCDRCGVHGNCSLDEMSDCSDFTQKVVKKYLKWRKGTGEEEDWMSTYLKFDRIYYGRKEISTEETFRLWESIAFSNFLQTAWQTSKENRFYPVIEYQASSLMAMEIVKTLEPDYILVWGNRAYKNFSINTWQEGTNYFNGYFHLDNGHIVKCMRMYHPTRASRNRWHKAIMGLISGQII